jgi:hypothetical protein
VGAGLGVSAADEETNIGGSARAQRGIPRTAAESRQQRREGFMVEDLTANRRPGSAPSEAGQSESRRDEELAERVNSGSGFRASPAFPDGQAER